MPTNSVQRHLGADQFGAGQLGADHFGARLLSFIQSQFGNSVALTLEQELSEICIHGIVYRTLLLEPLNAK